MKQGFDQKLVNEKLEKVEKLVTRVDLLQKKDQEQKIQNTFQWYWHILDYQALLLLIAKTGTSSKPANLWSQFFLIKHVLMEFHWVVTYFTYVNDSYHNLINQLNVINEAVLKVLCYFQFLKNTKYVRIVLNHFW